MQRFHAEGAKLVIADLSGSAELAEMLGGVVIGMSVNVSKADDVANMVKAAVDAYGRLDIAVNVAGTDGSTEFKLDVSEEAFRKTVDINLTGTFLVMKAAIPHMIAGGGGAIVNFSSAAAVKAMPSLSAYSAAKTV